MPKRKSEYVCRRCGLAVTLIGSGEGTAWKHASGGVRACGQPPDVWQRSEAA
jgi:hypothetical protein